MEYTTYNHIEKLTYPQRADFCEFMRNVHKHAASNSEAVVYVHAINASDYDIGSAVIEITLLGNSNYDLLPYDSELFIYTDNGSARHHFESATDYEHEIYDCYL